MALIITEDCIKCGACRFGCPNRAIMVDKMVYTIDPRLCNECKGYHDSPRCLDVCPVDCIIPRTTDESHS